MPPFSPRYATPAGDDAPFTLGTPRGLAVGSLGTGLREIWLHPLCVVGGGVVTATDTGVLRLLTVEVSAGHVVRTFETDGGSRWREVITGSPADAEFHYSMQPEPPAASQEVGIEFAMPLRLEWPMPGDALHPVRTESRRDGHRSTILVTGCDGAHVAVADLDGVAELSVADGESGPTVRCSSAPGETLRIAWRASTQGVAGLPPGARGVGAVLLAHSERLEELRRRTVRLVTGAPALSDAWDWAVARLSNFVVQTPVGGRGLMAGYAASRTGWNASRPGYAWFFGRDACWTIDALLAAGMFEEARDAITFLARTSDITGKVVHELTTSGVAHYDAADATPLFLRAVGAYAEWTADTGMVREWWPAVTRAFAFTRSCDRDGDGLPENSAVGHGWVEMGPLGGGAVTSYVAAIWVDALRRLACLARVIDEIPFAAQVEASLHAARVGLETLRLGDHRLALHRDRTGALSHDRTALAAVPIALGVDVSESVPEVLDELAGERFTAPFGLRMLATDDPRYDPASYHGGAVWPLFTGWAALADCRAGRVERGFARVASLAHHAVRAGAFAEVLHGETGRPAGVCPDQAWSAAMVIAPLVCGVGGIVPDALSRRLVVRAVLPASLAPLSLEAVRVGETRVSCTWQADDAGVAVEVRHDDGPPIAVAADETPEAPRELRAGTRVRFQSLVGGPAGRSRWRA
jgi:hypothetical protein